MSATCANTDIEFNWVARVASAVYFSTDVILHHKRAIKGVTAEKIAVPDIYGSPFLDMPYFRWTALARQ